MAMAVGGAKGAGGRRGRRRRNALVSEINITPLVDVMLVLLIIFMVAAPMLTVGVPIDLPQTQAQEMNTQSQPVTVTVTPDGGIFLGEDAVTIETLVAGVAGLATDGLEQRINVRGDTAATYGTVMQVMGVLSGAGYSRFGLIANQEQAP